MTAVDSSDQPLLGILTWADRRAMKQAEAIKESGKAHEFYLRTGCPAHPLYPFYKILWLREIRPEVFKRAKYFISAKEYINFRLTGKRVVDYSIASASGLFNLHTLEWDEEILETAGISTKQLFSLTDPKDEIGGLLPDYAAELGLPAGTRVFQGSSDAVNSSLGCGTIHPNQLTCMVGTSGAIRGFSDRPMLDEQERTWCYAADRNHYLVGGAINNGGLAVNWLKDALAAGLTEEQEKPDINQIMIWASEIQPGSEGLLCLPCFTAERSPDWNAKVRGVFYGLQLSHDQRHLSRALLEGVGFRLRSVLEAIKEINPKVNEIRVAGGFVQSTLWLQITADILNQPLSLTTEKESSAVAAALWVFLALGKIKSIEDVTDMFPVIERIEPDPHNRSIYDRQYALYQRLYQMLTPMFDLSSQE